MLGFGRFITMGVAGLAGVLVQASAAPSRVVDNNLIDTKVSPCEDFFQYACGQWLKKTEIPADRSKLYRFSEIDINTEKLLQGILKKYSQGQYVPYQKYANKMGAFYQSCMDEKVSDKAGKLGVQNLLARVDALKAAKPAHFSQDLARLLADFHKSGISALFEMYVDQDPGDAREVIPQVDQGGLGLPEKGYYLDEDPQMKKTRTKYLAHLNTMFKLARLKLDKEVSQKVFEFEVNLAKASLSPIERRDPKALYHKITQTELKAMAPQFDWDTYLTEMGIKKEVAINVAVPAFFTALGKELETRSAEELSLYLKWHALHSVAEFASASLQKEDFEFYGKFLNGQKAQKPRWKQCVASIDSHLGEALGDAFVQAAFGADGKKLASEMMNQIQEEVRQMFGQLDWMDQNTQAGALRKLNTLVKKVGYPEPSRNYDHYCVNNNSWFENVLAGNRFESERRLAKIGKPVDRGEWSMTASTNNAYYNPLLNEIVFPAGILQEPLFSVNADLAANYGATGATVGHEITHGFDDEGRQFDENGNLKDWWTENSTQRFNEKAQCLEKQYDQYTVADNVHVKGALTLGENIADLGGLKIALRAYQKVATAQPKAEEYQRFFVAYAQSWCGKATPEYEKNIVKVDPHSPARYRVNGVVVNMPEFAQAFSCKAGQPMNPPNRCQVW